MKTTDRRRNRDLAVAIFDELQKIETCECDCPDGWDESLYAQCNLGNWFGEIRISDHNQPEGGGWSESRGERHGEADISVVAKSGAGADLEILDDGSIVRVPLVRAFFGDDVPEQISAAVTAIVVKYESLYQRRREASKKAVATRKKNRLLKNKGRS